MATSNWIKKDYVAKVLQEVSTASGIPVEEILGHASYFEHRWARQVACYIFYEAGLPIVQIQKAMNRTSYKPVMNNIRSVEQNMNLYQETLKDIYNKLAGSNSR